MVGSGVLRLGCMGCLTALVLALAVGAAAWGAFEMMRRPDFSAVATATSDGIRAQQKIFDLLRRSGSGRSRTVTLSEGEVNAFLRRHLGNEADLPLRELVVRLPRDGEAEIIGQLPLQQVLASPPLSAVASLLPEAALHRGVWLTLLTRVTLETVDASHARRRLRLDVRQFRLGRLRLPEVMMRVLLDPSALTLLRWPTPPGIEDVRIEPGRLILRTDS
jgi:hypothetical protein